MRQIAILDVPGEGIDLWVSQVLSQIYVAGFRLPARRLPDFDIHYVASGSATFELDGRMQTVGASEIVFCRPGQRAGFAVEEGVSLFHCHFHFKNAHMGLVDSSLKEWAHVVLSAASSALRLQRSLFLPDHLLIRQRDRISEFFSAILRDQESPRAGGHLAIKAHLLLLLRLVSEESLEWLASLTEPLALGRSQVNVTKALRFIDANIQQAISVRDVADNLRLSPDYLGRAFKRALGESVGSYILRRRLVVAKDLLVSSGMSVKEVAASVGFRDQSYFSRVFKREEGVSPTDFMLDHASRRTNLP